MNDEVRTHKLHFKVDFIGYTKLIREFWAEGLYWKVHEIFQDMEVDLKDRQDIISGIKTFIPHADNPDYGDLGDDNWTHNYIHYPDYLEGMESLNDYAKFKQFYFDTFRGKLLAIIDNLKSDTFPRMDLEDVKFKLDSIPYEIYQYLNLSKEDLLATYYLIPLEEERVDELLQSSIGIPTMDEYMERVTREEFHICNFSEEGHLVTGWLSSNGDFYCCDKMGHDTAATEIIGEGWNDKKLYEEGWVKISQGMITKDIIIELPDPSPIKNLLTFESDKDKYKPTKKQKETLYTWEQYHNIPEATEAYIEFIENIDDN